MSARSSRERDRESAKMRATLSVSRLGDFQKFLVTNSLTVVGLDYSDSFFARAKFRGGAKNEKT